MIKYFILFWTFFLTSYAAFSQEPTVSLEIQQGFQQDICEGSTTELFINITPPDATPDAVYNFNLTGTDLVTNQTEFFNSDVDGQSRNSGRDLDTFLIVTPQNDTEYEVRIFGNFPEISRTITVTVEEIPNAGFDTDIFLCNRTTFPLIGELDGGPDAGGVWTDDSGTVVPGGNFDIATYPNGGAFTYTITTTGACPDQVAVLSVRPCGNNDVDNDGDPNITDPDDDNDGIPDADEDSFCNTIGGTTPVFVLEEDFGFGDIAGRSRFAEVNGLNFEPGQPQDNQPGESPNGEYAVATATYLRNPPANAGFLATNGDVDASGDINGRYIAINMVTANFDLTNPVFSVDDLPVTPNNVYDLSMSVVNTGGQISPNLRIRVVDAATNTELARVDTGAINVIGDWQDITTQFTPTAGQTIVNVEVLNLVTQTGDGNDIGIDNIFLSTQQCDFDRDGIPNSQDLDSDNDGIYDVIENNGTDANGDGFIDTPSVLNIVNSDTDAQPDFLDIDSDNDGIIDNVEGQSTAGYIPPSGIDSNFNGIDDAYEGPDAIRPVTTVGGDPDYLNTNVDADCLTDTVEAYDADRSGALNGAEPNPGNTFADADEDGLHDVFDTIELNRLTGGTNATNGQDINSFPNFHNPETPERDWREEFADIGPIDVAVGTVNCDPVDLFDEIIAIFATENAIPPTTGTWASPPGSIPLTNGNSGNLDPTNLGYNDGVYTYTIPAFNGTTCPPQVISLNITIDDSCRCPPLLAPVKVGADPTTCIAATPLPTLEVAAPPATPPGLEVRWFNADGTVELQSSAATTYVIQAADIALGTTTLTAQYYDPITMCEGDFVDFIVTATAAPEAGTGPTNPLTFCSADNPMVSAATLFAELTGADAGGTWTSPANATVTNAIAAENGTYTYTVTSNGCTDTATVEVEITTNPTITAGTPVCDVPRPSTYQVAFTVSANAAVTSDGGTVDMANSMIIDIPSGQDIIITATSNDNNACIATLNITAPNCNCPDLDEPTNPVNQVICEDITTTTALSATIPAGLVGRWFDANDNPIATAQSTDSFTPARADLVVGVNTFTVEAFDTATSCFSDRVTVTYTVNALPEAGSQANTPLAFCSADNPTVSDATLFAELTGADAGGTWTSPSNATVTTAIAAENGDYTYTVTTNGCVDTATVTVEITTTPVLSFTNSTCNDPRPSTYDVTYTVSANAVVTSSEGTVDTVNSMITGIPSGQDITITATSNDNNACIATLNVTAPNCNCPDLDEPTNPVNQVICEDITTTTALSATIPAGLVGRWFDANNNPIATAQSTDSFTPARADLVVGVNTFTVEAFDTATSCSSDRVTVTYTVNALPEAGSQANTPLAFCSADNPTVSDATLFAELTGADAGGTWTSPSNATVTTAIAAENGDYTYTVTTNGCVDTATVTVEITTTPVLSLTNSTCNDPRPSTYDVTYTVSANAVVTSDGGTVDMVNSMITGIPSGQDIIITATSNDNNACIATLNVTAPNCNCPDLDEPTNPVNQVICEDITTTTALSATIPAGLVGRWFDANNNPIATAQSTDSFTPARADLVVGVNTFTVEAFDTATSCSSDRVTVTYTVNALPEAGSQANTPLAFCSIDNPTVSAATLFAELTGADVGGTWTSPSNATVTTAIAAENGNYTYTVTTNGCVDTATVTVEITTSPVLTFANSTCNNPLPSTYDVTYTVSANTVVTSNGGTVDMVNSMITGIPSGQDIVITATSNDNNACITTLNVTAPDCNCPDLPEPTNPVNQVICEDITTTTALSATIPAGLVGRWFDANNNPIASAQSTGSFTPARADLVVGINTFTVEAFDTVTSCTSDRVTVTYTVNAEPDAGMGPLDPVEYCRDNNTNIDLFTLLTPKSGTTNMPETGGVWTLPGGGTFNGTLNPSDTSFTNGTYTYTVSPVAGSSCNEDVAFVDVVLSEIPTPVAPIVDPINCTAVALPNFTGANQRYFTLPGGSGPELSPGDLIRTTTTIYLVETNGSCSTEVDFTINIETLPVVSLDELEGACFDLGGVLIDDPITIEAPSELDTTLYELQWMFNGSDIAGATNTTLTIDQIGDYSLRFFLRGNTSCGAESNTISLTNLENPEIIDIVKDGRSVLVAANGDGLEYSLNNGAFQESNIFRRVPFGEFTVTVRNACIEVSENDRLFGFPEFFTPNGDGENDFWNVQGTEDNDFEISIFDRYGNLIAFFRPEDPGWDGRYNIDIDMPADDYWYYAVRSTGEEFRGHFSLIR